MRGGAKSAKRPSNAASPSSTAAAEKKRSVLELCRSLVFDPELSAWAALALLAAECVLNVAVVLRVPYTEIDWIAYMQEVEGVRNGTYDYALLKGDTGPLVYPAGFVWIYYVLYLVTDSGKNIRLGQFIFVALYLLTLAAVFRLMVKSRKLPPYALVFMSLTSYRVHSIYVLRLFNDPVAMLLLYVAVNLFASGRWSAGSVFYSLAVSVKMNILLFAPALFLAYLATRGVGGTFLQLAICATVQAVLALPFLMESPLNYLKGAFDLGRVFLFKWTVNWRFLPEEVFVHRGFHAALLAAHVIVLLVAMPKWWRMLRSYATLRRHDAGPPSAVQLLLLPLFMSNFIGIAFARSLHYQFYVWYFHQLHYLLWCTALPVKVKLLVLGLVEICWNTYPSTEWSSATLHACHFIILVSLLSYVRGMTNFAETPRTKQS